MKNFHTFKEISSQVSCWEKIYSKLDSEISNLNNIIFSKDYDEIILFGCGSSYNLAISASFYTNSLINCMTIAVPSSELLFNTDVYIKPNKQYLLVGFSRSGETTETIRVIEKLKKSKNINSLVFTCKKDNSLRKISDNNFYCEGAEENSIVMTKSFSSMLFAYCLLIAKFIKNTQLIDEFNSLIKYLKGKIDPLFNQVKEYVDNNDYSVFFCIGSGFNYGLAVEADLKMKEMSQVTSYSYYILELSHGPKALIDEKSLCLILTPDQKSIKLENFIKEYINLGSRMIITGYKAREIIVNKKLNFFLDDCKIQNEMIKSFINIPFLQFIAFLKTIKNNLNPDLPRNLNYTTKI